MKDDRIISSASFDDDQLSLRPRLLNQYIGQKRIKEELSVYIKAAKQRRESLDHVLLYGPPGLGKTTLSMIIANELNVNIRNMSGPAIEKSGDLVAVLNELEPGDVLFIDEIHRLPKNIEEILYSAMEDFYIDIIVGQEETSHPIRFTLPPFTLIGATTRVEMLSSPLRSRFGILGHMVYYSDDELVQIIKRSAKVFNIQIDKEVAYEISLRSRGTPRIANRLLKRIRDFSQVLSNNKIDKDIVKYSLDLLHIDRRGLDDTDRKLLMTMINLYNGGPVGLSTIAANMGEEAGTIEDVIEPYLLQIGFIKRTARGRVVTDAAYRHLEISKI